MIQKNATGGDSGKIFMHINCQTTTILFY